MKNIIVTGGAGFIGSNFIHLLLSERRDVHIINIDLLTYAGNLENLADIEKDDRYTFIKGDICDKALISSVFERWDISAVINFAAESHVDRSIVSAEPFVRTNVCGTQNLLDCAKAAWQRNGGFTDGVRFLQVSTDEVYGALGKTGYFTETTPISPNSPYSASKAAADLLVTAYNHTYGMPTLITRCSNNYGPYQFPEKLIPLMINNCMNDRPLPVYGDGMQVRDWLHVEDHCRAILTVLEKGKVGEVYNVGGNNERANIEIVKMIIAATGKDESLITHVKDRLGHDRRYAIDSTKIQTQLGWKPQIDFESGMKSTIQWYLDNTAWIESVTSGDYMKYYERMYGGN